MFAIESGQRSKQRSSALHRAVVRLAVPLLVAVVAPLGVSESSELTLLRGDSVMIAPPQQRTMRLPKVCPSDDRWIAFEELQGGSVTLHINNYATGEERELLPFAHCTAAGDTTAEQGTFGLDWRPGTPGSGIWAVYVGNCGGTSELYLYDLQTNSSYKLGNSLDSAGIGRKSDPVWSPDGRVIAYVSNLTGEDDIYDVRGMDRVIGNPQKFSVGLKHEVLAGGPGDQRGPIWCPAEGSGYLAYTDIAPDHRTSRILIADPLQNQEERRISYVISDALPSSGYLAPSWSPDGQNLSYFTYEIGNVNWVSARPLSGNRLALGLSHVEKDPQNDDLRVSSYRTKTLGRIDNVSVVPNTSDLAGPAWLPDGKGLVISTLQFGKKEPFSLFSVIKTDAWSDGLSRAQWLLRLSADTNKSDSPSEIRTTSTTVAYTSQRGPQRVIIVNKLLPQFVDRDQLQYLPCTNRVERWSRWSSGQYRPPESHSSYAWLFNPLPRQRNLLINRPIIIGPAVIYLGVAKFLKIWPFTKGTSQVGGRDWRLPQPPSGASQFGGASIGVHF